MEDSEDDDTTLRLYLMQPRSFVEWRGLMLGHCNVLLKIGPSNVIFRVGIELNSCYCLEMIHFAK